MTKIQKPWTALGISQSLYYKRKREGDSFEKRNAGRPRLKRWRVTYTVTKIEEIVADTREDAAVKFMADRGCNVVSVEEIE